MKRMSRFIAFFLVLFNFASFALPAENIRITIVLINEVTGEPISNNFDIKVSSHPDGKLILVQTAKKRSFYEINTLPALLQADIARQWHINPAFGHW